MRYTYRQPVGLVMYAGPRVEAIEMATGSPVVVHLADCTTREPACLQFYGIAT